jgi:hypothetical protein
MDLEEVLLLDCFLSIEQIVPVFVRKTGARKEELSPILGEKYGAKIFINTCVSQILTKAYRFSGRPLGGSVRTAAISS